jgi:uncharacterized protein YcfJ
MIDTITETMPMRRRCHGRTARSGGVVGHQFGKGDGPEAIDRVGLLGGAQGGIQPGEEMAHNTKVVGISRGTRSSTTRRDAQRSERRQHRRLQVGDPLCARQQGA